MKSHYKESKLQLLQFVIFLVLTVQLLTWNGASAQVYSWYRIPNSPYNLDEFDDIFFLNTSTGWLVNDAGTIFKSIDGGGNWELRVSNPSGTYSGSAFLNESTGWISSRTNNMYKTTNGGYDLSPVTNFPAPQPTGLECIYALNSQFLYGCGAYTSNPVFVKSTDGGTTWSTRSLAPAANGLTDCRFLNESTGFLTGITGAVPSNLSIVFRTTDGGSSWQEVYRGNRQLESGRSICFVNPQTGYIALERTNYPERFVLKTTNGGLNWAELAFPTANESSIGFINESTGWIGGYFNQGYLTTDGGVTWANANIGQHIMSFFMFGDSLGFACGQYVYKYAKTNGIVQTSSEVPEGFSLRQNFPNPFNSGTRISYNVSKSTDLFLQIYDLTGRLVETVVNEYHTPGTYEVTFEAGNLGSGVYIYKLTAGDFSEVRKMTVLK